MAEQELFTLLGHVLTSLTEFHASLTEANKRLVTLTLWRAGDTIGIYQGDKDNFEDWIQAIEVQYYIHSFEDKHMIRLAQMTTSGSIWHFIMAFVNDRPSTKWCDLKAHLMNRYLNATAPRVNGDEEGL